MGCETQKAQYDLLKSAIAEQQSEHEKPTPAELKRLYLLQQNFMSCMSAEKPIATSIPVSGTWNYGGKPGPVITENGNFLTVNMSSFGRPAANGIVVDSSTILVFFPDDNFGSDYEGKLLPQGVIAWSNNSEWTRA